MAADRMLTEPERLTLEACEDTCDLYWCAVDAGVIVRCDACALYDGRSGMCTRAWAHMPAEGFCSEGRAPAREDA